jgi:hypothetical protein
MQLNDQQQVHLFLEYAFFLFTVTDRLAYKKWGDPVRAQTLHATLERLRKMFSQQAAAAGTEEQAMSFFESCFLDTQKHYERCGSIMGDGDNTLDWSAATRFIHHFVFVSDYPISDELYLETSKKITRSLIALLQTPLFHELV